MLLGGSAAAAPIQWREREQAGLRRAVALVRPPQLKQRRANTGRRLAALARSANTPSRSACREWWEAGALGDKKRILATAAGGGGGWQELQR